MIIECKSIIARIRELPTLPTVIVAITDRMADPNSSSEDVAEIIECDQSLTAQVLRLANSSFFGFKNQIASINHAISLLGFVTIGNLVLATSVLNRFKNGVEAQFFNPVDFWKHSTATAVAAKVLAHQKGRHKLAGEVFTAGLLHDIGKMILHLHFPGQFLHAVNLHRVRGMSLIEAEQETFGMNHSDVGCLLGAHWRFPGQLLEAIQHHHHPSAQLEHADAVALVHVADVLVQGMELGSSGTFFIPAIDVEAWKNVADGAGSPELILAQIHENYKTTVELMRLT